jgi:hypothetical protein
VGLELVVAVVENIPPLTIHQILEMEGCLVVVVVLLATLSPDQAVMPVVVVVLGITK